KLPTHTSPNPTLTDCGPSPTGVVAVTRFVAGSTRASVLSVMWLTLPTHTEPSPASRYCASEPVLILATTRFDTGSMRASLPGRKVAQTAPSPTVTWSGSAGRAMRAI